MKTIFDKLEAIRDQISRCSLEGPASQEVLKSWAADLLALEEDKYVVLDDETDSRLARMVMEAAYEELGEESGEREIPVKNIARAFRAAREKEIELRKGHKQFNAELEHCVATAIHAFVSEIDTDDCHPYSLGAVPFLKFAAVCCALNAFSDIECFLNDEAVLGGYMGKEAADWCEKK
jgi:hypothetical protein